MTNASKPRAVGWIILRNNQPKTMNVLVEPYGLAYEMPPGDNFQVYFPPTEVDIPSIEYAEDVISIHAFDVVIYLNGEEIHNYSEVPVTFPKA